MVVKLYIIWLKNLMSIVLVKSDPKIRAIVRSHLPTGKTVFDDGRALTSNTLKLVKTNLTD